jgi:hypothetical protein
VPPSVAGDDAYLSELKAEAERLEYLGKAKEELRQSEEQERRVAAQAKGPAKPVTASLADFEKELSSTSPASFTLYTSLSSEKRLAVFKVFKDTGKLSLAKRRIVDLHLNI